jgi:hypothetical protein
MGSGDIQAASKTHNKQMYLLQGKKKKLESSSAQVSGYYENPF